MLHLALHAPEIPNNTGTLGRTAVAIGARLHLIEPLGFDLSEKACRRAGLDYWAELDLVVHASWSDYLEAARPGRLWACSARSSHDALSVAYADEDHLLCGGESDGLPAEVLKEVRARWGDEAVIGLPQRAGVRSLNLACAATAVAYAAVARVGLT